MYVPKLMCTQHPDATVRISVQEEVDEAVQAYVTYGCDEVMVDYEGKLTPYAQPKEIVLQACRMGLPLGERFFVTPRVPNPFLEDFDRVDLSIEAGIIANYYSGKLSEVQAVKWFIVPMVEDVEAIKLVQRLTKKKLEALNEVLNVKMEPMELIPLIEDANGHLRVSEYALSTLSILKEFNVETELLRVFLGKSDAAVKSGHIASALSIVYALNELHKLSQHLGIRVEPVVGMGVPPFRGALNNPELVNLMTQRYRGYSTATIQSAVRYDLPYGDYQRVREVILADACSTPSNPLDDFASLVDRAAKAYRELVTKYVNFIQKVADGIPATRERISWRSYGRIFPANGEPISVPRAIVYTSAWYACGVPPAYLDAEFIIGIHQRDELDLVLKLLPGLEREWVYDSRFYVRSVAAKRLDDTIVCKVDEALDIMGVKPEPSETYRSLLELNPLERHWITLGRVRGFLG